MCGISGYYSNKKYADHVIVDQLAALAHRGPDSEGIYRGKIYTGGMRRLSINDLAGGSQPLFNENKKISVIYNGEIYNYKDIRKDLEKRGHIFKTNSDGEVICHLYEERGDQAFQELDGMFAIALRDDDKERLILVRDLAGEKPLYYSNLAHGGIAFASEVKSLAKFPDINLELNYQAIWDLPTFLWIPEPETIYKYISALMPGHILTVDKNGTIIKKYQNLFEGDWRLEDKSEEQIIYEIRQIVELSIKDRLLSDAPVGCFLSGGLDSSIIATIASKHIPDISTFTVGFEDIADPYHGKADESVHAEAYAKKLGTNHRTILVNANMYLQDLDKFCLFGDQPWGVSSGLGVLSVSRVARNVGVKVLLTGDGADECFGGYSWYFHLNNTYGKKTISSDKSFSFQNFGTSLEDRLSILNSYDSHTRAWAWHYYASESEKKKLFNKKMFDPNYSSLRWFKDFKANPIWNPMDYIEHDRSFYLTNEMLKKADLMNMANSVEGRVPFVAPAILNVCKKLPFHYLVRNNELKWILRKAFSDVLPPETTHRPKHGFNHPVDHWLKNEWSHVMKETFSRNSTLFKLGIIDNESYDFAEKMLYDPDRLNGHTILCYIILNRWLELHKK